MITRAGILSKMLFLSGKISHNHSRPTDLQFTVDPFDGMTITIHHDELIPLKKLLLPKATFCKMAQNIMPEFRRF